MKVLSRDFTVKERILILLLVLILLGLAYYQFIDQPVRSAIEQAHSEQAALETELTTAKAKLAQLERMQNEIDTVTALATFRPMPSYSNREAVNKLLNDVLGTMNYSIAFSNTTRSGDLVRRSVSLTFTAPDYRTMEQVFKALADAEFRCIVDNISCSSSGGDRYHPRVYNVSMTATFYETMVGATTEVGLSEGYTA